MSLADELLADLEENDQDDLEKLIDSTDHIKTEIKEENEIPMEVDTTQILSIRQLAKLRDSDNLKNIMKQIERYNGRIRKAEEIIGPVESDPEYQLIVEANNIAADVDTEIGKIFNLFKIRSKFLRMYFLL